MVFDVRLRAYEPGGDTLGFLPEPSKLDVSFVHNDGGALSLEYSDLAAGGPLLERGLEQGLEVAAEVPRRDGTWFEPDNGRFVLINRDRDQADATKTRRLTLPSYRWLLSKARNLDTANLLPPEHTEAGKRPFYSETAGVILATLLDENAARGGVPLSRGWTTGLDSAGAAWAKVATLYYDLGLGLDVVLDNLAAQGMCDWRTVARELRLYNADSAAISPDLADKVRLWLGIDVADAPSAETLEDVVSTMLIRGDGGLVLTEENPSAPTPWGKWEGFISQGGVSDEGTARSLAQADLARAARVRGQYTRALILAGEPAHLPMVDYGPGSWITAPTTGTGERVRVQQVTLTKDAKGVSGSVVLNDRFLDAELRRAKRMQGITGGASGGGSGSSNVRPAPEGPDDRQPAAPLGLVVTSDAYIDARGIAQGALSMAWGAVTTATDGTALDVSTYELAMRENEIGAPWNIIISTDDTEATRSTEQVGRTLQFKVRARGRYAPTPGVWSDVVTMTVSADVTPPPVPSAPILTTKLGTVTVKWDGQTDIGTGMPRDFDRVDIYQDGVIVGELRPSSGISQVPFTGLPVQPTTFEFAAVDRSDNVSALSAPSTITPKRIEGPDIQANTVTTNELAAGAIDGMVITGALIRTAAAGARLELSAANFRAISGGVTNVEINPTGVRINEAGGLVVADGGSAIVADGGALLSQYFTGRDAFRAGKVADGLYGFEMLGDTDVNRGIFSAYWHADGSRLKEVTIGDATEPARFTSYSTQTTLLAGDFLRIAAESSQSYLSVGASTVSVAASNPADPATSATLTVGITNAELAHYDSSNGALNAAIRLEPIGIRLFGVSAGSGTANMVYIPTSNVVERTSSSLRYKTDVTRLDMSAFDTATILDALAPREWTDALHPDRGRYVGTIAEVLDDAGLTQWVIYDEDGRPDALSYDRMANLLAVVVQRQQDHLDTLTQRLTAVEAS